MKSLGNYMESEEDNWDDLVDNNYDFDDVLRTSIHSSKSNASSLSSPVKNGFSGQYQSSPTKKQSSPQKSNQKKPYQSISLADFEKNMQQNLPRSSIPKESVPFSDFGNVTLNKNLLSNFQDLELDDFEGEVMTLKRSKKYPKTQDSDFEDGLDFPDDFNIPKNAQTIKIKKQNLYSPTLDLSPDSSFGSNHQDSSSSASAYSESITDVTEFYNDIEIKDNNFEKLLELRLKKAKYQAEIEEREFYLSQQQKKLSRSSRRSPKKANFGTIDIMNLPDDSNILNQFEYSQESLNGATENEDDFFVDFENFNDGISLALANEKHKNLIIKNEKKPNIRERDSEQYFLNDPNVKKFYNSRTAQLETIVLRPKKTASPKKVTYSTSLKKKKSTPILGSSKVAHINSGIIFGSVKDKKKSKLITSPLHHKVSAVGNELDNLQDLNVDYNREIQTLKSRPSNHIDLAKFMEPTVPTKQPKKSILKNANKNTKSKIQSNIGLIKNLNYVPKEYVVDGYGGTKMVYNPTTFKWEGNEADSRKFASIKPTKQPALITFLNKKKFSESGTIKPAVKKKSYTKGSKITSNDDSDFEELTIDGLQIEGNMYFNPRKLCWITLHDDPEEEEDPFKDIGDLDEGFKHGISPSYGFSSPQIDFKSSQYTNISAASPAMPFSGFSQRRSVSHKPSLVGEFEVRGEFDIPRDLISKFEQEEERWVKKTRNWFQISGENEEDKEYLWEIRNMVMGGSSE